MPEAPHLVFAAIFAASAITPGPDTAAVMARASATGALSSVPLGVGLTIGKLALLGAAFLGLGAAVSALGASFLVVQLLGAGYIAWLGWCLLRRPAPVATPGRASQPIWREAVLGAGLTMTNPVALAFYLALLPGVVDLEHSSLVSFFGFALVLTGVMAAVVTFYAGVGVRVAGLLQSRPELVRRVSGIILLATAGWIVVSRSAPLLSG